MIPPSLSKKIKNLNQVTNLVLSYQQDIHRILEQGLMEEKLRGLEPSIEVMQSITNNLSTLDSESRITVQNSITSFRTALDTLVTSLNHVKNQTISENHTLKTHHKRIVTYTNASKGITS